MVSLAAHYSFLQPSLCNLLSPELIDQPMGAQPHSPRLLPAPDTAFHFLGSLFPIPHTHLLLWMVATLFIYFFHLPNKFFDLLMWCITLIDLWKLKNSCIPGMNPISSWRMIFLMYCWIQITGILLKIFASMFISDIGLHLFSCDVSVWFWYQGDGGLIEWVWKFSFLCNFLEQFQNDRG